MFTDNENNTYGENEYFLLDLKLPNPKADRQTRYNTQANVNHETLPKFNFVALLEKIFDRDLRTKNPLLNPSCTRYRWKERFKKKVKFSITEIKSTDIQLPYCRRVHPHVGTGRLHAPTCSNSAQETVEILGQGAWLNRVFILDTQMSQLLSQPCNNNNGDKSE